MIGKHNKSRSTTTAADAEVFASDQLKAAKSFGDLSTNIGSVLFAALVVSFMGMWIEVPHYQSALSSLSRYERLLQHYQSAFTSLNERLIKQNQSKQNLADFELRGVRSYLLQVSDALGMIVSRYEAAVAQKRTPPGGRSRSGTVPRQKPFNTDAEFPAGWCTSGLVVPKESTAEAIQKNIKAFQDRSTALRNLAESLTTTEALTKSLGSDKTVQNWVGNCIAEAYLYAVSPLAMARVTSLPEQRFLKRRAVAKDVAFKLLGLDFSVDGFWAWNVWYLLFAAGVIHLWLARRAILRRHHVAWESLAKSRPSIARIQQFKDSLPIWCRPLWRKDDWVGAITNRARLDIVMDALSAMCTILMWTCFFIAVLAVSLLAVISTDLLSEPGRFNWIAMSHAAMFCVLSAVIVAALLDWYLLPQKTATEADSLSARGSDQRLMSRRAWLFLVLGGAGAAVLYQRSIQRWLRCTLLHAPRFNKKLVSEKRPRQRRRRPATVELARGFYRDYRGQIHYVDANQKSRSLASMRAVDGVTAGPLAVPWIGNFDKDDLTMVHPSALLPFVREGVLRRIKGYRHVAKKDKIPSRLRDPEVRSRYHESFELVWSAIELDLSRRDSRRERESNKMPNLQLYDLLGAVAFNGQSPELLKRARQVLAKVHPPNPTPNRASGKSAIARIADAQVHSHSRHAKRKLRSSKAWFRRKQRIEVFIEQRLGPTSANRSSEVRPEQHHGSVRVISRGTWDPKQLSAESANDQHVVRTRKSRQRQQELQPGPCCRKPSSGRPYPKRIHRRNRVISL